MPTVSLPEFQALLTLILTFFQVSRFAVPRHSHWPFSIGVSIYNEWCLTLKIHVASHAGGIVSVCWSEASLDLCRLRLFSYIIITDHVHLQSSDFAKPACVYTESDSETFLTLHKPLQGWPLEFAHLSVQLFIIRIYYVVLFALPRQPCRRVDSNMCTIYGHWEYTMLLNQIISIINQRYCSLNQRYCSPNQLYFRV